MKKSAYTYCSFERFLFVIRKPSRQGFLGLRLLMLASPQVGRPRFRQFKAGQLFENSSSARPFFTLGGRFLMNTSMLGFFYKTK